MGVARAAVVIVGWYMDHATMAEPWNVEYVLAWCTGGEQGSGGGGNVVSEIVVVKYLCGDGGRLA